jgi:hypothetical protein
MFIEELDNYIIIIIELTDYGNNPKAFHVTTLPRRLDDRVVQK